MRARNLRPIGKLLVAKGIHDSRDLLNLLTTPPHALPQRRLTALAQFGEVLVGRPKWKVKQNTKQQNPEKTYFNFGFIRMSSSKRRLASSSCMEGLGIGGGGILGSATNG